MSRRIQESVLGRLEHHAGDIGDAVAGMRAGLYVSRAGWNGKGMHLFLADDGQARPVRCEVGTEDLAPFVVMCTATRDHVPWLCSQTDLLAEDWGLAP